MDEQRRLAYLSALEIEVWRSKDFHAVVEPPKKEFVEIKPASIEVVCETEQRPALKLNTFSFDELREQVSRCTRCGLHATRKHAVFGVGHARAELLIVGEAPGADEDRQGEPFVGKAGQLLNQMLRAIGLAREEVFICNILKCRPPNNRDPLPEEVEACRPYLNEQIGRIEPRLVLAVGRIAAQSLLGVATPVGKLRSKKHIMESCGLPVVVTYHPAYLLRSPKEKRKAWEDLKFARGLLMESTP